MNAVSKKLDKKTINLVLTIVEIVAIVILLAISLVAMFTIGENDNPTHWFMQFIHFLQTKTVWFFILIVLPLIGFFLFNGYLLFKIVYGEKASKPVITEADKAAMIEEAKRQLREELMKEIQKETPPESKKDAE